MAKSTLLTINSWKKDLLSIALTFFAVKIVNIVHPMGNCEKLTLPIPFCIPNHFFNIWWVFRVNLFIDLNFNISRRVYDVVFYWIVHLKKNILYLMLFKTECSVIFKFINLKMFRQQPFSISQLYMSTIHIYK